MRKQCINNQYFFYINYKYKLVCYLIIVNTYKEYNISFKF